MDVSNNAFIHSFIHSIHPLVLALELEMVEANGEYSDAEFHSLNKRHN